MRSPNKRSVKRLKHHMRKHSKKAPPPKFKGRKAEFKPGNQPKAKAPKFKGRKGEFRPPVWTFTFGSVTQVEFPESVEFKDFCTKPASFDRARLLYVDEPVIIASGHERPLKNLSVSPGGKIVTCDLKGVFKFWKLKGTDGAMISTHSAASPAWYPEDVAWHPDDQRLFAAFRASTKNLDCAQVAVIPSSITTTTDVRSPRSFSPHSVLSSCSSSGSSPLLAEESTASAITGRFRSRSLSPPPVDASNTLFLSSPLQNFQFLDDRPHGSGYMRCIKFMPWTVCRSPCFATCGDDHGVALWSENDDRRWRATVLHISHTSSVYGLAGAPDRSWILTAGLDKQLTVYDVIKGRIVTNSRFNSFLLDVEFNSKDPNLLLLGASSPGYKQLRLFDLRCFDPEKPLNEFGWEMNNSQVTKRIRQCWSPDGMYISTGSIEELFHVYDIRYNGQQPMLTIKGHTAPVLKAQWHPQQRDVVVSFSTGCFFIISEAGNRIRPHLRAA